MEDQKYELIISVDIASLFSPCSVSVTFIKGALEVIDKMTLDEEDAVSFFARNKDKIKLAVDYQYKSVCLHDISLGKQGIYVKKEDGTPIKALFKMKQPGISLQNYLFKRMHVETLNVLYQSDSLKIKEELMLEHFTKGEHCVQYDSFFQNFPYYLKEKIRKNTWDPGDIPVIWGLLRKSKRWCPLLRFLLVHYENNSAYDWLSQFEKMVPALESYNDFVYEKSETEERVYSYPYADN